MCKREARYLEGKKLKDWKDIPDSGEISFNCEFSAGAALEKAITSASNRFRVETPDGEYLVFETPFIDTMVDSARFLLSDEELLKFVAEGNDPDTLVSKILLSKIKIVERGTMEKKA